MRNEHDFLGEMDVPEDVYYGVQTMRALDNFHITGSHLDPDFIRAMAMVKKAAALANMKTHRMPKIIGNALVQAADEIISGQLIDQFPVDPIQGGAGTSINMNMNEVLCNRALEQLGKPRGRYDIISPNNHANMAQSTNDVFPTSMKVCLVLKGHRLRDALSHLEEELHIKEHAFSSVIKMGRTHLQDAVPITLGQEMGAYASAVARGRKRIEHALHGIHTINMGGTAIGTGLNAEPAYIRLVARELSRETGELFRSAHNFIDMTNNTDGFADVSSAMKCTALVLIKMANDIRLMASGPRCGLNEVTLPARQPGSSIMPGKVNPVMAEVLDQSCYEVLGNDLAITMAVENGQFELNVMEPVMAYNLFRSMECMTNAILAFTDKLLTGLKANEGQCKKWGDHSVGIMTALLPHIGYEKASSIARKAYTSGMPVRDIIREEGLLSDEDMNIILSPLEMTKPGIAGEERLANTQLSRAAGD